MTTVEISSVDYLVLRCLSVVGVVTLLGIAVLVFIVWRERGCWMPWDETARRDRADLERIGRRR